MGTAQRCRFVEAAVILALVLAAYLPALRGGYIWDDDYYVTKNASLKSAAGLASIWLEPQATPQYYPLVHTSYWLEYRLWGLRPFGYHLINVLFHSANAILLSAILHRLSLPLPWVAALIFALHPVHVESVAWVTERKNVLSGFFYLCSLSFLIRAMEPAFTGNTASPENRFRGRTYAFSLLFFLAALSSKTVTLTLPVVALVILWWKNGRIRIRQILLLLPFAAAGLPMGALTAWRELHHVRAIGKEWDLSFAERLVIAGKGLWFYPMKIAWPAKLTFIYPKATIDAAAVSAYLPLLSFLAAASLLWALRRKIGRGPLAAVLAYTATIFPALGFVNIFPMRYSFVADHFQYLASIGIILLIPAGWQRFAAPNAGGGRDGQNWNSTSTRTRVAFSVIALALGVLTWKQGGIYKDEEALWRDTIRKNPSSWMSYGNLGFYLLKKGNQAEAGELYQKALAINPQNPEMLFNLGALRSSQGRVAEAERYFKEALRIEPAFPDAHNSLGVLLAGQGRTTEAMHHYRESLKYNPNLAMTRNNLANLLVQQGHIDEALKNYTKAIAIDPDFAAAHKNLGLLLAGTGRPAEAASHFEIARRLEARETGRQKTE